LHEGREKVFDELPVSQRRFWPMNCSTDETFRIKIGCVFFAQAKKVERVASINKQTLNVSGINICYHCEVIENLFS
jgi:hypothetical protein